MENSILIKNVLLPEGRRTNILIKGKRFEAFEVSDNVEAERVIDASSMAILPSFFNTHNHAAMVLLRGYADDMKLQQWLTDYIWPYEDKLTSDDIQAGSRMAIKEMVSTGTSFFSDMYFEIDRTIREVAESGMRAAIGITVMECHSLAQEIEKMDFLRKWVDPTNGRIQLTIDPHAIYTVGKAKLRKSVDIMREQNIKLHIHVAETLTEVNDCIRDNGMTPVRYLDSIGLLGPGVIAAHCVHVDKEEWDILAERGVTVSHCPCSNMKLGSGRFPYELAIASGVNITLGTDGASSNNNLDMREEMKFASLLAKVNGDPTLLPASEILKWATVNGARAFGIDAGVIAPGKLADFVLVDTDDPKMKPMHNLVSNWVYAVDSRCICYTFCDGKEIYSR